MLYLGTDVKGKVQDGSSHASCEESLCLLSFAAATPVSSQGLLRCSNGLQCKVGLDEGHTWIPVESVLRLRRIRSWL